VAPGRGWEAYAGRRPEATWKRKGVEQRMTVDKWAEEQEQESPGEAAHLQYYHTDLNHHKYLI